MPPSLSTANHQVEVASASFANPGIFILATEATSQTDVSAGRAGTFQLQWREGFDVNSGATQSSDVRASVRPLEKRAYRLRLAMLGSIVLLSGLMMYLSVIVLSLVRLAFFQNPEAAQLIAGILWYSGMPTSLGIALIALDFIFLLPRKRLHERCIENCPPTPQKVAVALMSYNDEASIGAAVRDFIAHPMVTKVIVVDNNSKDHSAAIAAEAGASVITETAPWIWIVRAPLFARTLRTGGHRLCGSLRRRHDLSGPRH